MLLSRHLVLIRANVHVQTLKEGIIPLYLQQPVEFSVELCVFF